MFLQLLQIPEKILKKYDKNPGKDGDIPPTGVVAGLQEKEFLVRAKPIVAN